MDIGIFIIAHKECKLPVLDNYHSLLVGAKGKNLSGFEFRDDTGIQISEKNGSYCELTGLYWIRHNMDCEVIGISHYRRFFTKSLFSKSPQYYLSADDVEQILNKHRIILPRKLFYPCRIKDTATDAPNQKDLMEMEEALTALCPEYLEDYHAYLSKNGTYLLNMFIMRQVDFRAYCDWLFPVLEYIEDRHDMSVEDAYRSRLFGFLSERLLNVWVMHNIQTADIYECRVVNIDIATIRALRVDIYNVLKKLIGVRFK